MSAATRWGALVCAALVTASCHSIEPGNRAFAYNLQLGSLTRDFEAQRQYECQITFELDIHVPLPDSFTTVADAQVRRDVYLNSGEVRSADTVVHDVTVRVARLARDESSAASPDSVEIVLSGAIAESLHGVGFGGDEGRYDGDWICGAEVPPAPSAALQEQGYPEGALEEGDWHLFAIFPID